MGAAESKNVTKQTIDAISNVTSSLIQNVSQGSTQNQLISVQGVAGNVTISGNYLNVLSILKMAGVANALNTADSRQSLQNELAQKAKALVKDINLLNVSDAENIVKDYITQTTIIANNLTQSCSALFNSNQTIIVNQIGGNVQIEANHLQSINNVFQDCVSKAVGQNKVLNDLQVKIDQASEASTLGFSIWGLVAILAFVVVGILAVVLGPALIPVIMSGGKTGLLVGIVFLIIGAIFLLIWWFWSKRATKITVWAKSLGESCHPVTILKTVQNTTPEEAQDTCTADKSIAGFFFDAASSTATFYSKLRDGCSTESDTRVVVRNRRTFSASTSAFLSNDVFPRAGDLWINTSNATFQELLETGWTLPAIFDLNVDSISNFIGGLIVTPVTQPASSRSIGWVMDSTQDQHSYRFTQADNSLIVVVPGKGTTTLGLPDPNVAGIAYKARKSWMLYTGIGFIALGAIMASVLGFRGAMGKDKKKDKKSKKVKETVVAAVPVVAESAVE